MKIAHIVGNRPQFIKLSLLHRAWQQKNAGKTLIIHTGQHFSDNMSAIFFEEFGIPAPDHQLHINSLPHAEMIGRMLIGLDPILAAERPDMVIVYGDTNTTLAGALAARKRNIPLAHVESGIRTGKEDMPEESNRTLTDRLADLNFACTWLGRENLLKEGFTPGEEAAIPATGGETRPIRSRVWQTGDLMLDAALLLKDRAREESTLLQELSLHDRPFVLATIHRAENVEDPVVLGRILEALHTINEEIPVLFPIHPRTRQIIEKMGLPLRLHHTAPLGYLDMLALVQSAQYVVTDSGGLSREAFFFRKPTLVIMQNPFWPEIFAHGACLSAPADTSLIRSQWEVLRQYNRPFQTSLFGDGRAAEKISEILLTELNRLHA
jgi:UDP-GlcNAc3NAcA epimerase